MYSATIDPLEAAMNPEQPERSYFGSVNTDWYFCVLQRGVGKAPFDASQHSPDQRRVAIHIDVLTLPTDRNPNPMPISRDLVDFEREWTGTTLPSLKALGLDLRTIKGRYVHIKLTKTAEYTAKDGTIKDKTAIRFIEVFPDIEACTNARDAIFHTSAGPLPSEPAQPTSTNPGIDRKTAAMLLPGLWASAQGKPDVFFQRIASIPDLAAHFTPESAEVKALLPNDLPF